MKARIASIFSAVAAMSCCLPPLILLGLTLLGVGTAGLAGFSATVGSLKWYFMLLAIAGLGYSYYMYFREKQKCQGAACKFVGQRMTRTMLTISTITVFGFLVWSAFPTSLGQAKAPITGQLAVFDVSGMTCGGCELAVDGAVTATELADSVKSSFSESVIYVWYSGDTDPAQFEAAMAGVGFKAVLRESEKR